MEAAQTSGSGKLRVMCSYGGQILPRPRPRTTSFWYVGGDTRILSMDRSTVTTLSSLVSHLSSALSLTSPFSVKYQLPHLDLDSLISLASDDDLHILIDEHNRLSSSRIRLFLFPLIIPHPKTESWFFDALNSAAIMQNAMHHHHHFPSPPAPDSMLLETTSSFGSASSSTSFTNLPPLRVPHPDDNDALFKFSSSDTIPSENSVSSIVSPQQNIISYQYHDPVEEARLSAAESSIEVESTSMPSSGVMANINTNVDNIGTSSFPQFNQVVVERPHLQFVQAAAHFQPSCHQLVYQPVPPPPRPLQHLVYHHPNQPSPLYLVPIIGNMPPKPNSLPIICASGQASLNLNASPLNYFTAANATTSLVYVPCNGSLQQREIMDSYPMNHTSQNVSVVTSMESPKYGSNELDDEIARVQIYKSQPPPPTNMHSKYQTMTKDTTNLLSEALTQLHVDNLKQQITETSQPQ